MMAMSTRVFRSTCEHLFLKGVVTFSKNNFPVFKIAIFQYGMCFKMKWFSKYCFSNTSDKLIIFLTCLRFISCTYKVLFLKKMCDHTVEYLNCLYIVRLSTSFILKWIHWHCIIVMWPVFLSTFTNHINWKCRHMFLHKQIDVYAICICDSKCMCAWPCFVLKTGLFLKTKT